jgi:hypothetical protein
MRLLWSHKPQVLGPRGSLLTNRMSESFTYGSVGGVGPKPGPYPAPEARPVFWISLWERYVESQVDYRAGSETLARKLVEAGTDAWQLLEWLRAPEQAERGAGVQARLLKRVFGEQFEVVAGQPAPLPKEKVAGVAEEALEASATEEAVVKPAAPCQGLPSEVVAGPEASGPGQRELGRGSSSGRRADCT